MKRFLSVLLLALGGAMAAHAQVAVEVTLAQDQFLRGESIPAAARVSNRSGRTLSLGDDNEWLVFNVQTREGNLVGHEGDVPVQGAFSLETSRVATKRVDLAPYFTLSKPGRYFVSASVRIKDWDGVASSPPKTFDVVEGTKVWSREMGVPSEDKANQLPEVRNYTLVQANFLRSELRLYFRLTDAGDRKVLRVFPLGTIVSFARPEAEVDSENRVHVLHQNWARTSIYTVIGPNGEIVKRELYDHSGIRPKLSVDAEGKIIVNGGTRRFTDRDIPSSKTETDEKTPRP